MSMFLDKVTAPLSHLDPMGCLDAPTQRLVCTIHAYDVWTVLLSQEVSMVILSTLGIILVLIDREAPSSIGEWLCTGLSRRLREQAAGIEAQANPFAMTPFAPCVAWLGHMGFQPM